MPDRQKENGMDNVWCEDFKWIGTLFKINRFVAKGEMAFTKIRRNELKVNYLLLYNGLKVH